MSDPVQLSDHSPLKRAHDAYLGAIADIMSDLLIKGLGQWMSFERDIWEGVHRVLPVAERDLRAAWQLTLSQLRQYYDYLPACVSEGRYFDQYRWPVTG